jgi:cytochrome c-type biogenesis protein CcmH
MKRGALKPVIGLLLMMMAAGFSTAVSAAAAAVAPVPEIFSDPAKEARARHLQRQFFCLICAGESVDESNSSFAVDVRRLLREQIAEGKTDQQIKDFFVARYGAAILTKPPVEPVTWPLWLAPFGVLVIAGGVAWVTVKKAGKAGT